MSPAPTPYHQIISSNINDILKAQARKNVYQPDLVYISKENKNIISKRGIEGVPDLIVEVLSPSNIFTDRYFKKKTYREIGVKKNTGS